MRRIDVNINNNNLRKDMNKLCENNDKLNEIISISDINSDKESNEVKFINNKNMLYIDFKVNGKLP